MLGDAYSFKVHYEKKITIGQDKHATQARGLSDAAGSWAGNMQIEHAMLV